MLLTYDEGLDPLATLPSAPSALGICVECKVLARTLEYTVRVRRHEIGSLRENPEPLSPQAEK